MDAIYLITPFLAWLFTGLLKLAVNSFKERKLAIGLIGYGGFPSNHSAIVSSMVALVGLREGIHNPAFGVALTIAFIVILDASSLRRQIGRHAVLINKLLQKEPDYLPLRERIGHTRFEIAGGVVVGILVAVVVNKLFDCQ